MLRETIQSFLVTSAQVDPAKFEQDDLRVADLDLDADSDADRHVIGSFTLELTVAP